MKNLLILLSALSVVLISSCSKSNSIPAVSGTINGVPALTLYGTTGNATDYVFIIISTNAADKQLSYEGHTYSYTTPTANSDVYIEISPSNVIKGTLTTGTKTILTVPVLSPAIFLSTQYTSR